MQNPSFVRFVLVGAAALLVGISTAPPAAADDAHPAGTVVTAAVLLHDLTVQPESPDGYDRALFTHWVDDDANGCDTRHEVLIAESQVPVTSGAACRVLAGQWYSAYDGSTWTDPADVDVDHVVALQEAWQSGARDWSGDRRRAFANDLGIPESLAAVSSSANRGKGARDPAEWLPVHHRCSYVLDWLVVKYRWHLTVDSAEREALSSALDVECGSGTMVTVPPVAFTAGPPGLETRTTLTAGDRLTSDEQLTSASMGWYRALMQPDGNFVVYNKATGRATWSSGTHGHPGARAVMQDDGNFVVYSRADRALFDTGTSGRGGVRLVLQDDGNLVLYTAANGPLWNIGAEAAIPPPPLPTDESTLTSGGQLIAGQQVSSGAYRATVQSDGNFVTYNGNRALWQAGTHRNPGARLLLQADGNLVLYSAANRALWNTETYGHPGARLVMQSDGNLVLYRSDNRPLWNTGPDAARIPPPVAPPVAPPGPGRPPNPGNSVNCSDFRTWRDAQDWFETYYPWYGDVARLDADGDGIACENLPGAPRADGRPQLQDAG